MFWDRCVVVLVANVVLVVVVFLRDFAVVQADAGLAGRLMVPLPYGEETFLLDCSQGESSDDDDAEPFTAVDAKENANSRTAITCSRRPRTLFFMVEMALFQTGFPAISGVFSTEIKKW